MSFSREKSSANDQIFQSVMIPPTLTSKSYNPSDHFTVLTVLKYGEMVTWVIGFTGWFGNNEQRNTCFSMHLLKGLVRNKTQVLEMGILEFSVCFRCKNM